MLKKIYRWAETNPDKAAVVYNNTAVSYRDFARAIAAARRYLSGQDLPPSGIAVVVTGSRLHFWVVGLALRSLGLTTIALPDSGDFDGLRLSEIQCLVATDTEDRSTLEAFWAATGRRRLVVVPTTAADDGAGPPLQLEAPECRGGQILLTSGTTGTYKKFLIEPAYLATELSFRQRAFEVTDKSVFLISFPGWTALGYLQTASIWDAGGTVVLYQGSKFSEALRYPGITDVVLVPGMMASLLSTLEEGWRRNDAMRLRVGSAPLPRKLAEEAKQRLTRRVLTQIGATEASLLAVTPIEEPDDLIWHRLLPCREAQVVDGRDRLLPAGEVGIVRVRQLPGAPAYLDDPQVTRSFFREGYFYPGDLGVIRADGRLALHGRTGDVLNILGRKVAVAPIENMLQEALGVGGVCLISALDPNGETMMYLVIESPRPPPLADVQAVLRTVPVAHIPCTVLHVDTLPRNHMGKIQRNLVGQMLPALIRRQGRPRT